MILIADGGSSKTDWRVIDNDITHIFHTDGINPFHNSDDQMIAVINNSDLSKLRNEIKEINFYGAGLTNDKIKGNLHTLFQKMFPFTKNINIYDDLLAAARALFNNEKGIACIMGTGSNSCFFNGNEIADKVPALGYILGDEGSGASLGIRFINALYKREFSEELTNKLMIEPALDLGTILENVYKKQLANRYLASLTKIILKYIDDAEVIQLVKDSFIEFIEKNVGKYKDLNLLPIGFVGSIAYYFKPILIQVLNEKNLRLGNIIQSPIEELIAYHKNILNDIKN